MGVDQTARVVGRRRTGRRQVDDRAAGRPAPGRRAAAPPRRRPASPSRRPWSGLVEWREPDDRCTGCRWRSCRPTCPAPRTAGPGRSPRPDGPSGSSPARSRRFGTTLGDVVRPACTSPSPTGPASPAHRRLAQQHADEALCRARPRGPSASRPTTPSPTPSSSSTVSGSRRCCAGLDRRRRHAGPRRCTGTSTWARCSATPRGHYAVVDFDGNPTRARRPAGRARAGGTRRRHRAGLVGERRARRPRLRAPRSPDEAGLTWTTGEQQALPRRLPPRARRPAATCSTRRWCRRTSGSRSAASSSTRSGTTSWSGSTSRPRPCAAASRRRSDGSRPVPRRPAGEARAPGRPWPPRSAPTTRGRAVGATRRWVLPRHGLVALRRAGGRGPPAVTRGRRGRGVGRVGPAAPRRAGHDRRRRVGLGRLRARPSTPYDGSGSPTRGSWRSPTARGPSWTACAT